MRFDELLSKLPRSPGRGRLPVVGTSNELNYIDSRLTEFVAPDLSDRADIANPLTPSLLIISAAGAVGKSTVAREIAAELQAPLLDLAKSSTVAKHSFSGIVQSAFGIGGLGAFFTLLKSGGLCVVIDALDEARVKVNEAAFLDFLSDLAQLATVGTGVKFVLLGRTQTAETAWLALQDGGVNVALYTISPFTDEQVNRYLELRIDSLDSNAGRRIREHRVPFVEARDLLLKHLRIAIDGTTNGDQMSPEAREFIGYAPVLDAVAVLFARESNLASLRSQLEQDLLGLVGASHNKPSALLAKIVERILQREHSEKLVKNIKPALMTHASQAGWSAWDSLYTIDEQCERLLGRVLGTRVNAGPNIPAAINIPYEAQLAMWLPEHPFLRDGRSPANIVFESFIYAYGLRKNLDTQIAIEARLSESDFKPSRLFADFYFLMADNANDAIVPPRHIGLLYDALLSAESDTFYVRLDIESEEAGDDDGRVAGTASDVEGTIELIHLPREASGPNDAKRSERSFTARVSMEDSITFRRYVRDASVIVPCEVRLGADSSEFEVGPSVLIRCNRLAARCRSLVIGGKTRPRLDKIVERDEGVVIEARLFDGQLSARPVVHVPFSVNWPGAEAFPWTDFLSDGGSRVGSDPRVQWCYFRFRRIITTLRSHSRGSLARVKDKIEHARVLKNAAGSALLATLVHDGIFRIEGNFYHYQPDVASGVLGVTWQQLRRGASSDALGGYLARFVEANQDLFSAS